MIKTVKDDRMGRAPAIPALAVLLGLGLSSTAALGQIGCETPPFTACNDPTPATNINGNTRNGSWVDLDALWNTISQWYVTVDFVSPGGIGNISGSVRVPSPASGCPDVYFTATGTISPSAQVDGTRGATGFSWVARNPQPPDLCGGYTPVSSMTYAGTIRNKVNDRGFGTWTRDDGGSGTFTLWRYYVEPDGETTIGDGWGSVPGATTTMALFRQVLTDSKFGDPVDPNNNMFQGRQVFETSGGLVTDGCYDASGGTYPGGRVAIKGSVWNVGYASAFSGNTWGWDTIGWPPAGVAWYRTNLTPSQLPCLATAPQKMNIAVNGDSGGSVVYKTLYLQPAIGGSWLQVTRDGVTQTSIQ